MLGLGRTRQRGADRLTLGLAGLALATAGTVIGGELLRLARRRSEEAGSSAGMLDTAEQAAVVAGEAAQDTFFVAIEGYDATPRHETVLFNVLSGFLGGFALMRVSTLGHPRRLVAVRQRPARRTPHPPLRPRDPARVRQRRRGPDHPVRAARDRARRPLRRRYRPHLRRGGAAPRARGRLLDPGGPAQRPGQPRRRRAAGRDDHRPADAPPRRAPLRRARTDPGARIRPGPGLGRRVAILGLAAALLGGGGTASAAVVADAGALKAGVGSERWRLELADRDRRPVLAEYPAIGAGAAGTLGFRTAAGWQHATGVVELAARRRRLPGDARDHRSAARTIEVRLEPAGGGRDRARCPHRGADSPSIEAVGIGFGRHRRRALPRLRRALQRGRPGRRRGRELRLRRPLPGGGVPADQRCSCPPGAFATAARSRPTSRSRGCSRPPATACWSTTRETSYFRLRTDDAGAWSVEVVPRPRGRAGCRRRAARRSAAAALLRRPRAGRRAAPVHRGDRPPAEAGGAVAARALVSRPTTTSAAELARLRDADAPLSVLQTYTHYLPCGDQVGNDRRRERDRRPRTPPGSRSPPTSTR